MGTLRSPSPVELFIVLLFILIVFKTEKADSGCYDDAHCTNTGELCDFTVYQCKCPDGLTVYDGECIPGNCGPLTCGPWEACEYPYGLKKLKRRAVTRRAVVPHPVCMPMNNCDCMWNERCTVPHGKCACGDNQVRDHYGNCVDCDPGLSCPKCGHDRTCSINPGDKSSSCECLPGSVERDGECVWCKPCPRDCDRDHVCITPGFSDPYCGCPGRMDEIDGECVTCPRCPDCGPDRKCVVQDGHASCECPHSTYDTPWGCIPLNTCPPCEFDDYEVCVLPKNGSPHCECADGYVRDRHQKCVPCVQDECQANADCIHTGEICYDGQCKCADGWVLYDGDCIPDGYLGGSCKLGKCHGKRTHCSSHGQCECNDDCYKEPIWACIPKRKKYYWFKNNDRNRKLDGILL